MDIINDILQVLERTGEYLQDIAPFLFALMTPGMILLTFVAIILIFHSTAEYLDYRLKKYRRKRRIAKLENDVSESFLETDRL